MTHSQTPVAVAAPGHHLRYGAIAPRDGQSSVYEIGVTMHSDRIDIERAERDIRQASMQQTTLGSSGRNVVVGIGIDRYQHRPPLANAVRDAITASSLFQRMGFEQVTGPLLDDRATTKAIQELVTDDLRTLGSDDSLVLFYAGHGATQKHRVGDRVIRTGYLVPVDAQAKVGTWIELEAWLRAVARLPPRHILVVLDSCHSGIALDPIVNWRDDDSSIPLATLRTRRSRRVITSALADEVASDSGPVPGHSLFTSCLIEALTHGVHPGGGGVITGSELALYLQRRVASYPDARQTPDFGTFLFDDRGEMTFPIRAAPVIRDEVAPGTRRSAQTFAGVSAIETTSQSRPRPPRAAAASQGGARRTALGWRAPSAPCHSHTP